MCHLISLQQTIVAFCYFETDFPIGTSTLLVYYFPQLLIVVDSYLIFLNENIVDSMVIGNFMRLGPNFIIIAGEACT